VLGHDACGAVSAAIDSVKPNATPLPPHIASLTDKIVPAVRRAAVIANGNPDPIDVGREHLRDTIAELIASSELISDAIAAGTLAVVGANYRLTEGTAIPDVHVGEI